MRKTMRKAVRLMFLLISYCAVLLVIANATDGSTMSSVRIDLPNGDYVIETISENENAALTRASSTQSGYKTSVYYNSSNVAIFGVRVDGVFCYTGASSWATSSAATVYIYDSSASYVSKLASYSSNYATATGKVKYN
jgi:hypothetical protein